MEIVDIFLVILAIMVLPLLIITAVLLGGKLLVDYCQALFDFFFRR